MTTSSIRHLAANWPSIKSSLEKRGFVQLALADSKISTLKEVAALFGPIQRHARNPIDGITEIAGHVLPKKGQVNSSIEFFPHTDGHYLRGMVRKENGKFYRIAPPHLFLLQCVQQAQEGGMNVLVDGAKILKALVQKETNLLAPLFSRTAIAILRGEHLVMDAPIFNELSPRRYAIRFSYDRDFYCDSSLKEIFANFNERYILNQQYSSYHLLKPHQILVVDNQRMLHGRTAFIGKRLLRRLWLHDDLHAHEMASPAAHVYFESRASASNLLDIFAAYTRKGQRAMLPPVKTGICLSGDLEAALKNHLRKAV